MWGYTTILFAAAVALVSVVPCSAFATALNQTVSIPEGEYVIQCSEPGISNEYFLTYRSDFARSIVKNMQDGAAAAVVVAGVLLYLQPTAVLPFVFFDTLFVSLRSYRQLELTRRKAPVVFTVSKSKDREDAFTMITKLVRNEQNEKKFLGLAAHRLRRNTASYVRAIKAAADDRPGAKLPLVYLQVENTGSLLQQMDWYLCTYRTIISRSHLIGFAPTRHTKWRFIPLKDFLSPT